MKKYKVLIIEDDKFLLKLYSENLYRKGFEVISASTGNEGLNMIFTEKPDLIILNLILPTKDGFEVLDSIKSNSETKTIPVIVMTNLEQDEDVNKVKEMGAEEYLIKTKFSMHKLADVVIRWLYKS